MLSIIHFPLALLTPLILLHGLVNGFHSGAPCSSQFTMSPSAIFHGVPQNTQTRPPPYRFDVLDTKNRPVKNYKQELYKVKLTGLKPFRGFLIQVRPATKEGYPIGHLRVGEFVHDSTWSKQGIQVQPCPPIFNDSITHMDKHDKTSLEVMWRPAKNYGPVLFVLTIVENRSVFWTQWLPQNGFLVPDEGGFRRANQARGDKQTIIPKKATNQKARPITKSHHSTRPTPFIVSDTLHVLPATVSTQVIEKVQQVPPTVHEGTTKGQLFSTSRATTPVLGKEHTAGTTHAVRPQQTTAVISESTTTVHSTETSTKGTTSAAVESSTGNAVSGIVEGAKTLKHTSGADYCVASPCLNNGTCKNMADEDRYECLCTSDWTGKQCEVENFCKEHKCQQGECVNNAHNYTCKCRKEWTGEHCERNCPSYLCENNGTCILTDGGNGYGCACAPGWTGERCLKEVDHCESQPCQHGGTCRQRFNGFECQCAKGFMGTTCHRPCQDIYGSCSVWNEEQRCDVMRRSTRFFDINCAVTCKQCSYDNSTLLTEVPLPPVLESFEFLLGRWTLNASTHHRFPLDFGSNSSYGYREIMTFMAIPVPMFGTPSINYRSNHEPRDVHINVGFMTLKPLTRPLKVSLMSTGNDGITVIEEGTLDGTDITLTTQYLAILPQVDSKAPALVKREFSIINQYYLRESVERLGNNGHKDYFTKYYYKEEKFLAF